MTDVMELDGTPTGTKRKAEEAGEGERPPRRIKVRTLISS